jgi:hypothetical protein
MDVQLCRRSLWFFQYSAIPYYSKYCTVTGWSAPIGQSMLWSTTYRTIVCLGWHCPVLYLSKVCYLSDQTQPYIPSILVSGTCRIHKTNMERRAFIILKRPDDGWSGQSKHDAVYNKRIIYQICMVVFGPLVNTLFICLAGHWPRNLCESVLQ